MESLPIKRCTGCKEGKTVDLFYRNKRAKDGLQSICKDCTRAYTKTPKGAESKRRSAKKWWRNNPEKLAASHRRNTYGLSVQAFEDLWQSQSGECAICKRALEGLSRVAVDHDHATNAVRGLLCPPCNGALGNFKDDITLLESAIAYLKKYQAK